VQAISCRATRHASSACGPPAIAGGSHNLTLTSRLTQPGDNLDAMLRKLGRGFFVIELMGQGRQLRDRRLLARRGRLLGRGRPHRLSGARGHDRRQPARHAARHRRGGRRSYALGSKTTARC
jgi:hypothetical protein